MPQTNVLGGLLLLSLNILLSWINLACVHGNFSFSVADEMLLRVLVTVVNLPQRSSKASYLMEVILHPASFVFSRNLSASPHQTC